MVITSLENEKVKELVKLQQKKYRDLTNSYLVEGMHLVSEAYKVGVVKEIIAVEGEEVLFDCNYTFVSNAVMKKISSVETPREIVAVCEKSNNNEIIGNKILLLDEVQDPGNLGTMIRSAVAFNVDTIILGDSTVDLYNPKVLRSTQGMYNHVNVISMDTISAIKKVKELGITIYGTNVVNGVDVRECNSDNYCLVMGNEGNGLRVNIQEMCDKNLYIEMNNKVESLNVAIACSILLYELGR